MMKIKRILVALCSIMLFWSIPVFAEQQNIEQYTEKQVSIRNGILTFTVKNEEHKKDCRCYPTMDITIKEDKAGILKDGDIIYFETSRQGEVYCINEYLHIETKGLSAEEVKKEEIPQKKENEFAVRISRKNTNEPAEIKIHSDIYVGRQCDIGTIFSLQLNTDRTKKNNLFSGIEEQNIVLNEQFLKIVPFSTGIELMGQFPKLSFTANKNAMFWNGAKVQLKHNVFINEKGIAMISFDDYIELSEKLYQIGFEKMKEEDNIKVHNKLLEYIKQDRVKDNIKTTTLFQTVLDKKEDIYYVSLRTVAMIWNRQHNIAWNDDTKTITII